MHPVVVLRKYCKTHTLNRTFADHPELQSPKKEWRASAAKARQMIQMTACTVGLTVRQVGFVQTTETRQGLGFRV